METQPGGGDTDITIYTWDNRDRLTSVTHYADDAAYTAGTPEQTVTYLYDAFDRWIGETIAVPGQATQQTRYVYDGNQIVMQFDGSGSGVLAASNLSHRYLWGPAVDQLLADEQLSAVTNGGYDQSTPGAVVWALGDNLNTVRDLATFDPSANSGQGATTIVNHRTYSAYGELLEPDERIQSQRHRRRLSLRLHRPSDGLRHGSPEQRCPLVRCHHRSLVESRPLGPWPGHESLSVLRE